MPEAAVNEQLTTTAPASTRTDQPSVAVIARAGGGIPTVNVDDPRRAQ